MMVSVLLSRILGVVREQVLAYMGGTNAEMDAYVAAFILPEFINHLLAGGFLSITFIPIFQNHLIKGNIEKAWKIFSNLMTCGSLIMAGIIALCMIYSEDLLGLMGRHISNPAQLALTSRITRVILPAQLFFYWGALLMAVQFANKRFFIPALAPLFYNGGIIGGGLFLWSKIGIEGFAWGVLGGAFLGNVVVQIKGALHVGMRFKPLLNFRDEDLIKYVFLTLPFIVGMGMQFSNEILFRFFGSFLGEGAIASLNYSLRTMWALIGVFGQAVGTASFPFITQLAAEGKMEDMNRLSQRVITGIGITLIPISAIMIALSPEVIAVLFQRGNFTILSTRSTAPVLSLYLLGAFSAGATTIIIRNFYALQNTWLPMLISTIVTLLSIPIYWILTKLMGAQGIALAGSISMNALFIILLLIWTRRHSNPKDLLISIKTISKIVLISLPAGLISYGLSYIFGSFVLPFSHETFLGNLFVGICAGLPPLLLTFFIMDLMGISNFREKLKLK
jgi:putative peptidoglycan lipid II flippase